MNNEHSICLLSDNMTSTKFRNEHLHEDTIDYIQWMNQTIQDQQTQINTLSEENQMLRSMYTVLYDEFTRTLQSKEQVDVSTVTLDAGHSLQTALDHMKKEVFTTNTNTNTTNTNTNTTNKETVRHSWTEEELWKISTEYLEREGEWSEDAEGTLHQAFHGQISTHAIWVKWENCRFLDTGDSEYPSASKMHKNTWKNLIDCRAFLKNEETEEEAPIVPTKSVSKSKTKSTQVSDTRHKWTKSELQVVVKEYKQQEGEWSDEVQMYLFDAFHGVISEQAIWAKWENCRFLATGESEYPSASAMHERVWDNAE